MQLLAQSLANLIDIVKLYPNEVGIAIFGTIAATLLTIWYRKNYRHEKN